MFDLTTVILGTLIGFIMYLLKRAEFKLLGIKPLNILAMIYTQILRGTPVLLQVYLIVYGLPRIGVQLP